MPHIHTKPGQHDLTASAFILRNENGVLKVLLHTHKKLGILLQVGGHVELHETPWQAILHEIDEEAGYEKQQLQVLQPKNYISPESENVVIHPLPVTLDTHLFSADSDHFHTDLVYAFTTNELPKKQPGDGESTDLRWLTAEELQSYSNDELPADIRDIALYIFTTIQSEWVPRSIDSFQA